MAAFQEAARKLYGDDAEAFLKLYPVKSDGEVAAVAHQAATEAGFLQSSRTCALRQARFNRSATYVDLFTRKHPYAPGVTFADQAPATVGAYHTADVPYWLDTLDQYNSLRPTRDWTDYDRKLTDDMSGALDRPGGDRLALDGGHDLARLDRERSEVPAPGRCNHDRDDGGEAYGLARCSPRLRSGCFQHTESASA